MLEYEKHLAINKALQEAETPTENRVMIIRIFSWWKHPIKRYRQKKGQIQ